MLMSTQTSPCSEIDKFICLTTSVSWHLSTYSLHTPSLSRVSPPPKNHTLSSLISHAPNPHPSPHPTPISETSTPRP